MGEVYAFTMLVTNMFSLIGIVAILTMVWLGIKGLRLFYERIRLHKMEYIDETKLKISHDEKELIEIIQKELPDFSAIYFKEFAFFQLITLHHSFEERNLKYIKNDECDSLLNMHRIQIEEWLENKEIPMYEQHELVRANLERYKKEADKEILSIILHVNLVHYLLNEETNQILEGNKNIQNKTFKMEFIKTEGISSFGENIGKITKCPKCGSPVSVEINDVCEHCGVSIKNQKYSWFLNEITEI